ncbi:hypothetical protein FJ934_22245 [Mesorhizobium sp. B2-4-12]|uniref:hypothetical protein n=1 Tax=Mesorhizobium sp. B2-4-12 TaxID=2589937 RepID=UPI0011290798|nr:hypothetical protein [Mesorhizobium sp. B2-4-12]TPK91260.1 hypothetical protein FJ934_22245 [Mesorhizobium sp. B2-4-12]
MLFPELPEKESRRDAPQGTHALRPGSHPGLFFEKFVPAAPGFAQSRWREKDFLKETSTASARTVEAIVVLAFVCTTQGRNFS